MIKMLHEALNPKTVIVGKKHPYWRQFGREVGYHALGALAGGSIGAPIGAGIGAAIGRSKESGLLGAKIGGGLGAAAGGTIGFIRSTRKAELLRKKLKIGGPPIKPLRTWGMQALGTSALPGGALLGSPAFRLHWRKTHGVTKRKG